MPPLQAESQSQDVCDTVPFFPPFFPSDVLGDQSKKDEPKAVGIPVVGQTVVQTTCHTALPFALPEAQVDTLSTGNMCDLSGRVIKRMKGSIKCGRSRGPSLRYAGTGTDTYVQALVSVASE